jgi:hypothetical protein
VPGFSFGAPIVFAIDAVFIAAALGNPLADTTGAPPLI